MIWREAMEVAKMGKVSGAGHGWRRGYMAESEEAVDRPAMRYVLNLDTHITQLLSEGVALVA